MNTSKIIVHSFNQTPSGRRLSKKWSYYPTLSGTPQGGVISPLLANIYLNQLDKFVYENIIPNYDKGKKRRHNPEYNSVSNMIYAYRRENNPTEAKKLEKVRRTLTTWTLKKI